MPNYFSKPDALVDAVRTVLTGQPIETPEKLDETNKNDKSDDGEGLDAVQPKAVKKKFKDRKDKDIDNDGDVDSSDEYLHKRRKAVSKAMKEEVELDEKVEAYDKNGKVVGLYRNMADAKRLKPNHTYKIHKEEVEDNPANRQHLCAKNVVHESWGEGSCIPTMHADPDEDGNIEWYDVMFDHGIEEQVSIEELKVTKAESHIHASKKKIKESKDEDNDDDDEDDKPKAKKGEDKDTSKEDEENGKKGKVSGKKDTIDTEPDMKDQQMTSEMSDAQEKKREEIVLSMKKKMPEFKKKYGDRAKDVMYATATKMAMKEGFELGIEKLKLIEEVELDEATVNVGDIKKKQNINRGDKSKLSKVADMMAREREIYRKGKSKRNEEADIDEGKILVADPNTQKVTKIDKKDWPKYEKKGYVLAEEVDLDEAKSGTGYDLYHKDFSSAMKHAYDHAKKKHGITVDPSEIDNKVATGPAKPREGKTNTYRLKGDKGAIQIQVYNKGGSKPFELNMYKEEVELDEALKYEGKFKVGDVVRAYDFKPMKDRKNVYVQGKIVKAGTMVQGAKVYEVKIENDSGKTSGRRTGDIAYVPMQVSMFEYDGRIVKVSDIKEGVDLDEANVAKMSDDVLKSRLAQMEKAENSPAIQFEIKRLKKEMKKRNIQEEADLDEGFINIGGAKVKDDEKSILQHIKKTFPNVKKVRKDPNHGWIPVFEETELDEGQKLFMFKTKQEADKKAKEIKGKVLPLGPKNFAVVTMDLTVTPEEADLDEGRGRPRKDGTKSDTEDREQIQMQLRKSISLRGLKDVEFDDGKKVKISARDARDVLGKLDAIKAPRERQNAVVHIAKSHKNFVDFAKGKANGMDPEKKKMDILKNK